MHTHPLSKLAVLTAAVGLVAGCAENPASPVDDHDDDGDELTVELSYAPDHVHLLQSEVTFTVRVTDHHGEPVTDFASLQVERLAEGSDTWRGIDLELAGQVYTGTYVFASSGDYRLRVMGQRPGDAAAVMLHEAAEHMHVARAHAEAGPYRVEFESFPGHIHEGDEVAVRFWVMEPEKNEEGIRPPIAGLTGNIHCIDELHDLTEVEAGVYEATHTFEEAGEFHVGIHLVEPDGTPVEGEFQVHVVHGH